MSALQKGYKAGQSNPALHRPPSTRLTEDELLKGSFEDIVARSRSLHRNTSVGGAITSCYIDYMAERALQPIGIPGEVSKFWKSWGKKAGIDGVKSLDLLYQDVIAAQVESGDILAIATTDRSIPVEMIRTRLQLVSGTRVKTPGEFNNDPFVKFGVRYDENGRELGYYVHENMSKGEEVYRFIPRIDKRSGRFVSILLRRPDKMFPEMTRQLPVCTNIIQEMEDLASLWDAAIQGANVRALLNVIFEVDNPEDIRSALGARDNDDALLEYADKYGLDYVTGNLTPGSVSTAPLGFKPHTISHAGNMDLDVLFQRINKYIASAVGIPYEILFKDFSQTNFSSAKLGFDSFFRKINKWTNANVVLFDSLFKLIIAEARLKGILNIDFDMDSMRWVGPVIPDIDPNKNSSAEETRLNTGLVTRSELLAQRGSSYEEHLNIKQREEELDNQFGINPEPIPAEVQQ